MRRYCRSIYHFCLQPFAQMVDFLHFSGKITTEDVTEADTATTAAALAPAADITAATPAAEFATLATPAAVALARAKSTAAMLTAPAACPTATAEAATSGNRLAACAPGSSFGVRGGCGWRK